MRGLDEAGHWRQRDAPSNCGINRTRPQRFWYHRRLVRAGYARR